MIRIFNGCYILVKVQNSLGWSSIIFAKFLNGWWPEHAWYLFKMCLHLLLTLLQLVLDDCFVHKIRCWLMIIIGLFCSAVTNNNGLSFFQLTWFQKPLAASIFPIIATLRNGNMTTFKNNSFLNNVYVWIQACYEIFLVDSMYGSYRSAHVFETLLSPCYHL